MTVAKVYGVAPVAFARAPSTTAMAWTRDLSIGSTVLPEAPAVTSASTPDFATVAEAGRADRVQCSKAAVTARWGCGVIATGVDR
jgi:hypothetical protein